MNLKSFFKRPRHKKARVLFILKKHEIYGGYSYSGRASGLRHSAEFVSDMLISNGFESEVVVVDDNNDIDREVFNFKPDVVFIEALWVVPEKFDILKQLHPNVRWVVRIHSELAFLANEGIAIEWMKGYQKRGVLVSPNSFKTFEDFQSIGLDPVYLPNFYPDIALKQKLYARMKNVIHVGCFGAVRPLKNQLAQAVAAIRFADENKLNLLFHINGSRVEDNGGSILKNLLALFDSTNHQLVEHSWKSHQDFLQLLDEMDIALSVSFSETFSIVSADAVSRLVPIVTSAEVVWAEQAVKAKPTLVRDIVEKMEYALNHGVKNSLTRLREFSSISEGIWLDFLKLKGE
jgi:hypothetical protein